MTAGTNYPKWVYLKTASGVESRLVQSPDELKSIGESWAESPVGPFASAKKPAPKVKPRRPGVKEPR
jgi:hypothetical protein